VRTAREEARPAACRRALVAVTCLALFVPAAPASAYIYWTNPSGGAGSTIGRASLDGSLSNNFFIKSPAGFPSAVTVDAAHIYWTDNFNSATQSAATTIGRANLNGSGVNETFITGANGPFGIAVDSAHIYWANEGLGSGTTIGRANLDGSGVNQSFISGAPNPCGIAVDAAHIYWANTDTGAIGRANLNGTGVNQSFITGGHGPCGVAVDSAHIYWANRGLYFGSNGTTIGRANLNGTGVNQSFVGGLKGPSGVAVDGKHLYWSSLQDFSIGRANLDGTGVDPVLFGVPSNPTSVAVDALPSNTFRFSDLKFNRIRGTARLTVRVPGPGKLVLFGADVRTAKRAKQGAGPGQVGLPVRATGGARRKLDLTGSARVRVKVRYTPTGGAPNTKTKRLRLIQQG
jgi:virginiamycin B lyase